MVHTKDGNHGLRCYSRFLTRTNQCIHCRSVFKSRESAQAHTYYAEKSGKCPTSRSIHAGALVQITDLCCVVCGEQCSSHDAMQAHLVTHSLNPPASFVVPQHRHSTEEEQMPAPSHSSRSHFSGNARHRSSRRNRAQDRAVDKHRNSSASAVPKRRATRTTVEVSSDFYAMARHVAGDRERAHEHDLIQVDTLAVTLATSEIVRRYLRQGILTNTGSIP